MYALYRSRYLLGWLPALAAVAVIVYNTQQTPIKFEPAYDESTVEVALVASEPEPAPEVEETPPPEPAPEPEPVPEPESAHEPEPAPEPVVAEEEPVAPPPPPEPKFEPKPEPKPEPEPEPEPKPEPKPTAKPDPKPTAKPEPVRSATPPLTDVAAKPATPSSNIQALESGYLRSVRTELDRYKQYPTGRRASLERPTGDVVVWLLVDRSGKVLDSGIESQASSMLLNRAASNSLRRVQQLAPFPAETFAGKEQLRITATFNYSAP